MNVAALFVRSDSVYRDLGVDCWDEARDARNYRGAAPVVAHPPCRAWGRLSTFAKPAPHERDLAFFAVDAVRKFGGCLEHPAASRLFAEAGIRMRGRDRFGGWCLPIYQSWFGHRAPKATVLYVVGVEPGHVPGVPFELGEPGGRIASMGKREREATPPRMAAWLVDLASRARP